MFVFRFTDNAKNIKSTISALCLSETEDLLLAGYESGLLELWQHNAIVGRKQVNVTHKKTI